MLRFRYTSGRVGLTWYEESSEESAGGATDGDADTPVPSRPLPGHLESVTLPDGRALHYDYDASRNLVAVRHPDGTARRYHYEDDVWPNHLSGITDRTGIRVASWRYDEAGRGVMSERAGGVERVEMIHTSPASPGELGETAVTNSLGERSVYRWKTIGDATSPSLISSEGPGCATCPETGTTYRYTAAGQVAAFRTKEGVDVDYRRDDRGRVLEVRQREPSGTWNVVVRYEYRGRDRYPSVEARASIKPGAEHRIEYAYSPGGLLLGRTERGYRPVVADGAAERVGRLWPNAPERRGETDYPFDEFREITRTVRLEYRDGRLDTLDGPREDVADHLRFRYDDRNRLIAVDSPDGRQLRVTAFDALGRPGRVPNRPADAADAGLRRTRPRRARDASGTFDPLRARRRRATDRARRCRRPANALSPRHGGPARRDDRRSGAYRLSRSRHREPFAPHRGARRANAGHRRVRAGARCREASRGVVVGSLPG